MPSIPSSREATKNLAKISNAVNFELQKFEICLRLLKSGGKADPLGSPLALRHVDFPINYGLLPGKVVFVRHFNIRNKQTKNLLPSNTIATLIELIFASNHSPRAFHDTQRLAEIISKNSKVAQMILNKIKKSSNEFKSFKDFLNSEQLVECFEFPDQIENLTCDFFPRPEPFLNSEEIISKQSWRQDLPGFSLQGKSEADLKRDTGITQDIALVRFLVKRAMIESFGHLKMFPRRQLIFPLFDNGCWVDQDAWFEATFMSAAGITARTVREVCQGTLSKDSIVVDGTVGVGGTAVALCIAVPEVRLVGIDISPTRIQMAQHNLQIHSEKFVELDCCDIVNFLQHFQGKIAHLHLSPPWGGVAYPGRHNPKTLYSMEDIEKQFPLKKVLALASSKCESVGIWLPRSFSVVALEECGALLPFESILIDKVYYSANDPQGCHVVFSRKLDWRVVGDYGVTVSGGQQLSTEKVNKLTKCLVAFNMASVLDEASPLGVRGVHLHSSQCVPEELLGIAFDTFAVVKNQDCVTNDGVTRSKGGVFFHVLKKKFPAKYKLAERQRRNRHTM